MSSTSEDVPSGVPDVVSKVVSVEEMRDLEHRTATLGLPGPALMENAGRAVADALGRSFPGPRHVLVLVGPGNNGGDGLVAARHLSDAGYAVTVYAVNRAATRDARDLLLRQRGVPWLSLSEDADLGRLDAALAGTDVVLDAVLGTGRSRPITASLAELLDRVNRWRVRRPGWVVAVDLPTGVDPDSGAVDPRALRADLTIALGFPKRGLLFSPAVDGVGALAVAEIGIPAELAAELPVDYVVGRAVAALLPERGRDSNKGTHGRALILAGSRRYTGAPVLAALGAERVGAGLVTIGCPASVCPSLAAHTLETTFLPLPDGDSGELTAAALPALESSLADYRAVLVGPGIGRSAATAAFLESLLPRLAAAGLPVVIDADALSWLSGRERFWEQLPARAVLTPHPGEMSRLLHGPVPTDRIDAVRRAADRWNCVVVLKGAYSVVGRPSGGAAHLAVLPFANPALATAGTGDVLAGAIVGLLAQRLDAFDAAVAGGFVHGVAGELVRKEIGSSGVLAGEVAGRLPAALALLRADRKRSGEGTWPPIVAAW